MQLREDKMHKMTGGCLCGQVRYSATAEPALVAVCHCKNCQKQTGTAFSVVIGVPKSAISIEGPIKTFHDTGDSAQRVDRNFCSECGSPISSDVGTLDDTTWLDPKMHVYCDSAQNWTPIPEGSQKFGKMPAAPTQ
jgi:hypothetical protein